jgi:DNA integrity scanning protein DisA with diadenylate cyclase activity
MPVTDLTHIRLDSLESAVKQMSDRVVALAEFMERLVVLEERNSFVATQVKEVKDGFKESIGELKAQHADLEKKYTALNEKVVRLVTLCSVASAVISAVAPLLLKKFVGL